MAKQIVPHARCAILEEGGVHTVRRNEQEYSATQELECFCDAIKVPWGLKQPAVHFSSLPPGRACCESGDCVLTVEDSLDRIIPASGEGMTAEQTPEGETEPAHNPALLNGFNCIL